MAEELKRRSRLATALIAGPAVTVGLLGIGAAPVLADNHEGGSVVCSDVTESALEDLIEAEPEAPEQDGNVVSIPAAPTSDGGHPAFAYVVDGTEYTEATQLTVEGDELTVTVTDANPGFCLAEEAPSYSWTFEAAEVEDVQFSVEGTVVTSTPFPEEATNGSVEITAPSGATRTEFAEDGVISFDVADLVNQLELGFGPQDLVLDWSWSYYDDDFEQHEGEGSQEITVTAVPPLETVEDLSIEEIIAGLVGEGAGVENVQGIGEGFQVGQFSGWDALGIPAGLVLSTGNLLESWQAMTGTGGSGLSDSLDGDGDADLDAILEGASDEGSDPQTNDAAGVEFSFVPTEANVRFSYVFASDEYSYLENSDEPGGSVNFNDIFAFFVNGENYALFETEDGETLPVSIENINSVANSDLYNGNAENEDGERPNSGTEIGGYTNVLTFTAPVTPGELNTIKLVVADVNDGSWDSFVVLQGGSFEQVEGPAIEGGEFTTGEGEAITEDLNVNTNIEDPEWTINVTSDVDEEAGELEFDGLTWTFTPAEGFTGDASFTVTGNDGDLNSAPATITITVGDEDEDDDDSGDDGSGDDGSGDDDGSSGDDGDGSGDGSGSGDDDGSSEDDGSGDGGGDGSGDDSGDEGTEDEDESTTPVDDDDAEGGDGSKDDQAPAGDSSEDESKDGEDLAKTGLDSAGIGLIAGLLLLVGGGLAIFGYRGRFSRKA